MKKVWLTVREREHIIAALKHARLAKDGYAGYPSADFAYEQRNEAAEVLSAVREKFRRTS